jgi:hypothetical protein
LKEGRGKREEGRGKREEGRGKREEGRGKREEGRGKTVAGGLRGIYMPRYRYKRNLPVGSVDGKVLPGVRISCQGNVWR